MHWTSNPSCQFFTFSNSTLISKFYSFFLYNASCICLFLPALQTQFWSSFSNILHLNHTTSFLPDLSLHYFPHSNPSAHHHQINSSETQLQLGTWFPFAWHCFVFFYFDFKIYFTIASFVQKNSNSFAFTTEKTICCKSKTILDPQHWEDEWKSLNPIWAPCMPPPHPERSHRTPFCKTLAYSEDKA